MTLTATDPRLGDPPLPDHLRLILVRHGQTLANREHRLQGASDDPMTEVGQEQAALLGALLAPIALDKIISSDLKRSMQTAQAIANYHQLPVEGTPLLREWNCGEWDGWPASRFLQLMEEQKLKVSELAPPGGERLHEVRARACQALAYVMAEGMGKTTMLCSHGDFLRTLISCVLDVPIDTANAFRFENASYTILDFDGTSWNMMAMSCIPLPWVK